MVEAPGRDPPRAVTGFSKAYLEDLNRRVPEAAAAFNDLVNRIAPSAWADADHLSNPVLSRHPNSSRMVERILKGEDARTSWFVLKIARGVLLNYVISFAEYARYAIWHLIFLICRPRALGMKNWRTPGPDPILVDTFVLVEKVLKEGVWRDPYFDGLYPVLERQRRSYAVLPTFIGWHCWLKAPRFFRLLYGSRVPVITEFELLKLVDHLHLITHILRNPWKTLRLARSFGSGKIERLAAEECLLTLDRSTFTNYARYLLGRRIPRPAVGTLNLVSWFENQVIGKNLYRGIREGGRAVRIYGCQACNYCSEQITFYSIRAEAVASLLPEVLLANGVHYLGWAEPGLPIVHRLCPSFRCGYLFSAIPAQAKAEEVLIILSYLVQEMKDVLNLCQRSGLAGQPLLVKPHPSHPEALIRKAMSSVPARWTRCRESLPELWPRIRLVISSESGACVEAAAMGSSVILIANQVSYTNNPMPSQGRGLLWDLAYDASDLDRKISTLLEARAEKPEEIRALSRWYLDNLFTAPTEENIRKAFDLGVEDV